MQPHLSSNGLVLPHIPEPGPDAHPLDRAMWAIADALMNPVSPDGTIYDLAFINIPVVARHLARAGIGPVAGQAVIRAHDAPGGYRQWIDVDAPNPEPPTEPAGDREFPPPPDGWRVRPSIKLDEECR